jgi:hypothetical protein
MLAFILCLLVCYPKKVEVKIHRTIILPVVLYGWETWSLILREEHRLRVLENEVLRRIFGHKSDEVTGKCRKLQNEINDLYPSPNFIQVIKSRRMWWARHVEERHTQDSVGET